MVILKGKNIHDECLLYLNLPNMLPPWLTFTTKNSNVLAFGPAVKRTLDFWFDFGVHFWNIQIPIRSFHCEYLSFSTLHLSTIIGLKHHWTSRRSDSERRRRRNTIHYGNTGCRVFKRGIQNKKDFCLKNNIPKRK